MTVLDDTAVPMRKSVDVTGRPTFAEIDLSAVGRNVAAIKERVSPAKTMAVIKADAYGHGILEVADAVQSVGVDYLGVGLVEEGMLLRENGFELPILVFAGFFEEQVNNFLEYGLELTLFDIQRALQLSTAAVQLACPAKVHIKVDTGMGRIGIDWQEAAEFINRVAGLPGIQITGLYSHLAASDSKNKDYANTQIERFRQVIAEVAALGIDVPLRHIANSGAILDMPESWFDMVRPGVMMYGYYPSQETSQSVTLSPAMSLKSRVLSVREVNEGTFVSYNCTYRTDRRTRLAAVPIGYGDGYNRLLSNCGEVIISGRKCPVVGRVCMDLIMVDVGLDIPVSTGDEVVLMGQQGDAVIAIYDLCKKLDTIPYEVTCLLSARVPKIHRSDDF